MLTFYKELKEILDRHNVAICCTNSGSYSKLGFQFNSAKTKWQSRSHLTGDDIGVIITSEKGFKESAVYKFKGKDYITYDEKHAGFVVENILEDKNRKVFAFEGAVIYSKGRLFSVKDKRSVMLKEK